MSFFSFIQKRNRFRNYISIQAIVIAVVLLTFKIVNPLALASLITGFVFLVSSIGILIFEVRHAGFIKRMSFWGTLVFLLSSVLPVLYLRLTVGSGLNFSQAIFLGFSGAEIHSFSNKIFFLMVICYFVDSFKESRKSLLEQRLSEDNSQMNH